MVKSKLEQRVIDALEEVAESHGASIVDVEVTGATKAPCVRVRIEGAFGESLTLDEIAAHTWWVGEVVEALDPVRSSYTLEVSSPGLARPLRKPEDFERFMGNAIEVTTTATEGRRRYTGTIASAGSDSCELELDGGERVDIPYDIMKKCTLKPVFDFKGKKEGK